jgi:hypothetical protein
MAKKDGNFDLELNYEETKAMVTACILAQEPIMIHGKPGIGKSDMLREIARELGRPLIDIRLALLESVDIKGYPYLKEISGEDAKVLSFAMNEEFPRDPESQAIIFFDEINAAMPSTQLAMYQMILDRAIGNYVLPKGVAMVAAGNREADKGGIFSMPKPLENRFVHVEMTPRFEDWANWAITGGIHAEVIGYLAKNEQNLNMFDPQTSSRAFATPRSWAKASKLLKANEKASEDAIFNLISGCIGMSTAQQFIAFRKIAHEIPSAGEILSGKAPKLKKAGPDVAYMLITNCLYKLRETYLESLGSKPVGTPMTTEVAAQADNFLKYLLDNEDQLGQEFLVLPIKIAIQRYEIPFNQKTMPSIKKVMEKANDLLNVTFQ